MVKDQRLTIGIPKEIKPAEYRVAGLPEHVRQLRDIGCRVVIQRHAGDGSRFSDAEYRAAGAQIVGTLPEVYDRADLLWKVKEILPPEFPLLRDRHVIFTYLHPAPRPRMVRALRRAGCTAIAYEEMVDDRGARPLLIPMSRMAGAGAVALAAQFCQAKYAGCGKLLFRTPGSLPAVITILGGGTAGQAAARAALAAGATVRLLETDPARLRRLARSFRRAAVVRSDSRAIRRLLPDTDVLIHSTFWMPGDPHLVTRDMLGLMKPGSLIMDVSADPHGGIESSEITTHDKPIRVVNGILHYAVQNIPSLFSRSASEALSKVTWPYLKLMATCGVPLALRRSRLLRRGVVLWRGSAPT